MPVLHSNTYRALKCASGMNPKSEMSERRKGYVSGSIVGCQNLEWPSTNRKISGQEHANRRCQKKITARAVSLHAWVFSGWLNPAIPRHRRSTFKSCRGKTKWKLLQWQVHKIITLRYDARSYFNVRPKADMSQLILQSRSWLCQSSNSIHNLEVQPSVC